MAKDTRIETELNRLAVLFQDLPEDKLELMQPLIQNAAFMRITLDDLQAEVKKTGPVETYQNGANQCGRKQSSALQAYDKIIRDYASVIKTLSDKLPVKKKPLPPVWTPHVDTPEEIEERERSAEEARRQAHELLEDLRRRGLE